jgi:hypothetical protein
MLPNQKTLLVAVGPRRLDDTKAAASSSLSPPRGGLEPRQEQRAGYGHMVRRRLIHSHGERGPLVVTARPGAYQRATLRRRRQSRQGQHGPIAAAAACCEPDRVSLVVPSMIAVAMNHSAAMHLSYRCWFAQFPTKHLHSAPS